MEGELDALPISVRVDTSLQVDQAQARIEALGRAKVFLPSSSGLYCLVIGSSASFWSR